MTVSRADVCSIALADCFRGDGEILASPMGIMPTIGARLARATFEPHLVLSAGDAMLTVPQRPIPDSVNHERGGETTAVEAWAPFAHVFDLCWAGRRHVVMGAAQIDRFGNQNIACIGDWARPTSQLLGFRGAPGNSINHTTSYWIPAHSRRVFVDAVDVVCGVGYDHARKLGRSARFHELRHVVSDLGVFDFETPDQRMRIRSLHPGVSVEEVRDATTFDLVVGDDVPTSRSPSLREASLLREAIDPATMRDLEVPAH